MEMINNVLNFPQLPNAAAAAVPVDLPKQVAATEAAGQSKDAGDQGDMSQGGGHDATPEYNLRLTVDKDPDSGEWVYKAIDRYTGEVVRQLPRKEVLELKGSNTYQAGSIIKTDI